LNLAGTSKITATTSLKTCFELLPLSVLSQKLEVTLIVTLNQPGRKIYEFAVKESANYPVYIDIRSPTSNCNLVMIGEQVTHLYCKEIPSFEDTVKELNRILSSRDLFEARIYKIELYLPLTELEPIVRLVHALYLSTIMCKFEESIFFIRELEKRVQEELASKALFKKDSSCAGNLRREFRELKKKFEKMQLAEFLDQLQAFAKIYVSCKA